MFIKNSKVYDYLKFVAQVFLPAVGAAYFSLAGVWGLPAAEEVVGTVVIVDTFLGTVLQISGNQYPTAGGEVLVEEQPNGEKKYTLDLDQIPEEIDNKEELRLKVVNK